MVFVCLFVESARRVCLTVSMSFLYECLSVWGCKKYPTNYRGKSLKFRMKTRSKNRSVERAHRRRISLSFDILIIKILGGKQGKNYLLLLCFLLCFLFFKSGNIVRDENFRCGRKFNTSFAAIRWLMSKPKVIQFSSFGFIQVLYVFDFAAV